MTVRPVLTVGLAGALTVGLAATLIAGAGPIAVAAEPATPTSPAPATIGDTDPGRTYGAPSVAVDPADPRRMAATLVELRTRRCGLMRSQDGGATWRRLEVSPSPPGYPYCFVPAGGVAQASVAFGRNGTLYYAMSGWDDAHGAGRSVLLARSTDLGDTWRTTVVRDARPQRGAGAGEPERNLPPSLVVDSDRGDDDIVHVGSSRAPGIPWVAISTDGGRSFPAPRDIRGDGTEGAGGAMAVDRRGNVYAAWTAPPGDVFVGRSGDSGRSFTAHPVAADAIAGTGRLAWSPAGGGRGALHLVFERAGEVMYSRSGDGGFRWSEPRPITDGPARGRLLPNVAVAPDGRVDVAWWDGRSAGPAGGNDVYYASSSDGGRSWSRNVRITDRTVDRTIGSWPNADVNGPPGLASTRAAAVLAWDDTRNGNLLTQAQDIYTATVRYPLPRPAALAAVSSGVAGGIAGLAVGLILLGAALDANGGRFRRRSTVGGRDPLGVGW